MTSHLRKLRATTSLPKWVPSDSAENHLRPNGYALFSQNTRLYRTKSDSVVRIPWRSKKAAQKALLDYFRLTRNIPFLDAQNMSLNSPVFLRKLLVTVCDSDYDDGDMSKSISRYLRYNPDNEFEPFFESLGLKPEQYGPLLPWDSVFLSDDGPLLGAYRELRSFGFSHRLIGKIFLEAAEVFHSGVEILASVLRDYEKLGLGRLTLVKLLASSPRLLTGNGVDVDFVAVWERLKSLGFEMGWIEGNLEEGKSYNWSHMLEIFSLFSKIGLREEQTVETLENQPDILFEDSGKSTVLLLGFLLKLGYEKDKVCSLLIRFPRIKVSNFVSNLKRCRWVLNGLKMEPLSAGGLIRSQAPLIGSYTLMTASSLVVKLHAGKRRICRYILENPEELKNLRPRGAKKLKPVPTLPKTISLSKALRNEFLLGLGYVEGSFEMSRAQKLVLGKGGELGERFDLIASYGLDRDVVCSMVRSSPGILNVKKSSIERKVGILVRDFGYPISCLSLFPGYLYYAVERIRLRLSMYEWLKNRGLGEPGLGFCTAITCPEKDFIRKYVNGSFGAVEVWQDLKDNIYSKQTTI